MTRPITLFLLSLSLSIFACSDKKDSVDKGAPTPTENAETPGEPEQVAKDLSAPVESTSCSEQAAELRSFLTKIMDKNAEVKAPWPTGDAEVDAWIEETRPKLREMMKPAGPAERQEALTEGVNTKPAEEMYRDCPEGLAALQAVASADPDKRTEAFIKIADGVEACDCKVNIGRLKAAYYMTERGPD